jgi:RNA polymerase sigma factor (sigma-70 family)
VVSLDNKNTYSFDEVKHILYCQASKIIRKFGKRRVYQIDELVNEAWMRGKFQKEKNIKFIALIIYHDMFDYVRGRVRKKNREELYLKENTYRQWKQESRPKNAFKQIDNEDSINYYLSFLSEDMSIIVKKYYLENLTQKQIGEELCMTESNVSIKRNKALKIIQSNI